MATDTTHHQWTPPPGRHQVSMGGSMTRFLKQRKGIQPTKQNKAMPTSNFYQFKYNFMPESVDTSKPGVIELATRDITTVRVERASHQTDEVHVFRGKEEPAKEVECVLIYDPENGTYTLEKLDSSLILNHEGRGPPKVRQPSASPLPTALSPASTSKVEDDVAAEIFRELDNMKEENADDDNDDEIPLSRKLPMGSTKLQPVRPAPPDVSGGKPRPKLRGTTTTDTGVRPSSTKPSSATSAVPRPQVPTSALQPPAPIGTASPDKGKAPHVPTHSIDVEEEELVFGQPTRQIKGSRISPQPAPSPIALPGDSESTGLALPSGSGIVSLPGQDDEDDDEEWDQVAGTGGDDGSIFGDGDADEGEEINVDQFTAEVNRELGGLEEDDGDAEGDDIFGDGDGDEEEPVAVPDQTSFRPMSLNQFAGGALDDADDDYSSSSEDSDDD